MISFERFESPAHVDLSLGIPQSAVSTQNEIRSKVESDTREDLLYLVISSLVLVPLST